MKAATTTTKTPKKPATDSAKDFMRAWHAMESLTAPVTVCGLKAMTASK